MRALCDVAVHKNYAIKFSAMFVCFCVSFLASSEELCPSWRIHLILDDLNVINGHNPL